MKNETVRISDEDVKIKLSICSKCSGIVRAAVSHQMDRKMKKEFLEEVMMYDLSVLSIPLLEYRENKRSWCDCLSKFIKK